MSVFFLFSDITNSRKLSDATLQMRDNYEAPFSFFINIKKWYHLLPWKLIPRIFEVYMILYIYITLESSDVTLELSDISYIP